MSWPKSNRWPVTNRATVGKALKLRLGRSFRVPELQRADQQVEVRVTHP
jgi:hypothetical protein